MKRTNSQKFEQWVHKHSGLEFTFPDGGVGVMCTDINKLEKMNIKEKIFDKKDMKALKNGMHFLLRLD